MLPLYPVYLLILLAICQRSLTLPLTTKEPMAENCTVYSRALLNDISDALSPDNITLQNIFFKGINCTQQSVELNVNTDTPSACAPHGTSCFGESESNFNQETCKHNIGKDLHHYYMFLTVHPGLDTILKSTILLRLRQLIKNCFPRTLPAEDLNQSSAESRYDDRLSLCKTLKGFQIRTITINRALGYIQSGEHSK